MRPVATGRPGTEVIPTGWAEAHQPAVEGTLVDATVALYDPDARTAPHWDAGTDQNVSTPPGAYWSGGARIQILNQQAQPVVVANDPETVADYLVVIPARVAGAKEGHRVQVADCDDPDLAGKSLRVATVVLGSHRFERDLFCTLTD